MSFSTTKFKYYDRRTPREPTLPRSGSFYQLGTRIGSKEADIGTGAYGTVSLFIDNEAK